MVKSNKTDRPDGSVFAELFASGMKLKDIAAKYNVTKSTVGGALRTYRIGNKERKLFEVDYGKPLQLVGDFMVFGDVHVPTTDYDFALMVIRVAKHYKIKRAIIAGDWWNFDMFSRYPAVTRMPTWEQERDAGKALMQKYVDYFDEIIIIMGNHDRRIEAWAGGSLDEKDIFSLITTNEKVKTSNFGYCFVKSNGIDWMITHSTNYSVNQLVVADQLAQKYQMNIISHHEHHAAKGFDRFKRYVTINNGGLFDKNKMAYVNIDSSKMPGMMGGFTALKSGCGNLFTPSAAFTDWSQIE